MGEGGRIMEQISWTLNVQVTGGPKISTSRTETFDAYDKITVDVPAGDGTTPGAATVEVQPGGTGQVQFLLIKSSVYAVPGEAELTYKVNVDTADAILLDRLHLLVGEGAVGLLGAAPQTLLFSNNLDQVASIEILVGRKATA
jgi:hypothetical protein